GGGWLVLDEAYQDVGFAASFRCAQGCKTGVLFRAEKTSQGMKGVLVSYENGEQHFYRVVLDGQGQEVGREALRRGGGQMRIAPPPDPGAPARGGFAGRGGRGPSVSLPLTVPDSSFRANDWDTVEIFFDANIVRAFLNNGGENGGVAEEDAGRYGPLALYAGGTSEVRFKDVSYKDLGVHEFPPEKVSSHYRMQRLSEFYYAWGAAAGDFNHDGVTDVVAGPYIYWGPEYTNYRE